MDHEPERRWLVKTYRPAPRDGPAAKQVKSLMIKKALESKFSRKYEYKTVSRLVKETFPHTETKASTIDRTMHVFGIEEVEEVQMSTTVEPEHTACTTTTAEDAYMYSVENRQLKARIRELEERVRNLEYQVRELEQHL